ncbi:hypothetical protein [Psychroserpens sp.]
MKLHIIILLYLLMPSIIVSQEEAEIETLKLELKQEKEPKQKIAILEKLWMLTQYKDDNAAAEYANKAIGIAEESELKKELAKSYERLGIAQSHLNEYVLSNTAYLKAIELHKSLGNKRRVGSLFMNQAINYKNQSKYDSAILYVNKSKPFIDERCCKDDSILMINFNAIKAQIHIEQGKYLLSLDNSLKAAKLSEKIKDTIQYADNISLVGDANEALGNYDIAIDYLKESLNLYIIYDDIYFASDVSRNIGELYTNKEPIEIDSSELYHNNAIKLAKSIDSDYLEMQALNSYAEFLIRINQYDKAKIVFESSQKLTTELNDGFSQSRIDLALGKIYYDEKKYDKALSKTNEALKLKKEIGLLTGTVDVYQHLAKIYKAKGDYKESLSNHEEFKTLADSIYNKEKATRFDELQTKFETERKESEITLQGEEIKTLSAQAENDKLTKTLYGIGVFSLLAIVGLLYFGFKQRIKKNKIAREKQEEIFKQEIAFKKKELTSQTLHLVQKSTFIQELKENLERIKKSPELFKVEFRRIVMLLKKESAEDKDWEVFKSYFSEVHNNFDHKIKAISEDITEKEIRLASFLRMNLSTKEIATMLNVLPDSVLKSKYRLKKKLQLAKEDDLTHFLNTL